VRIAKKEFEMETIVLTQLSVSELRQMLREEIEEAMRGYLATPEGDTDEIGGTELAQRITGLKVPTIYSLCSARKIPHSKRGKKLYFSKNELLAWLRENRRRTVSELAAESEKANPSASAQKRNSNLR
jgi:hypothetical protein